MVQTASKFCLHQCGVKPTRQGSVPPIYVNTFLLKPWELVCGLYPPWQLVELVHTG
jgi:hypothetical protein